VATGYGVQMNKSSEANATDLRKFHWRKSPPAMVRVVTEERSPSTVELPRLQQA